MGVSLSQLVNGEQISFEQLKGKTIAIDAYNTIYQFLSIVRDKFTGEPLRDSHGMVTSHLSGLFYRTIKLVEFGVTPVFVFDGEPPEFKKSTIQARVQIRKASEEKWKAALEKGDMEKVRLYAQGASRLTEEMVHDAHILLELMGISWVQAPSEGEAQATHMLKQGLVWAVGSQDWDSLLFGAERMVKNLTLSGKRKIAGKEKYRDVTPELIELKKSLSGLGINHDQLIMLGILIGTDYNPGGVKGVGPKTALKLVKEHKTPDTLLKNIEWSFDIEFEKIFDFFKNPPAKDIEIKKQALQPEELVSFLVDSHDFGKDRIETFIKKLESAKEERKQAGLGGFFR